MCVSEREKGEKNGLNLCVRLYLLMVAKMGNLIRHGKPIAIVNTHKWLWLKAIERTLAAESFLNIKGKVNK